MSKLDKQQHPLPEQYRPSIDELKGDMQVIAQAVEEALPGMGIPVLLALAKVGGGWMYISKMEGATLKWRNDQIRAMYDQGNITGRELARFWGLSQSSIEKILAQPGDSQQELAERQLKLF